MIRDNIVPNGDDGIPIFNEFTPEITKAKEFFEWELLSRIQQYLIFLIVVEKRTRRSIQTLIQSTMHISLSFDALATFAIRSAYSLKWVPGQSGGNNDYLCDADMLTLEKEIAARAEMGQALDTVTILDEAKKLKRSRQEKAVEFLKLINSDTLSSKEELKQINKPSRTWVNKIIQKVDSKLSTPIIIDNKRFMSCDYDTVRNFYSTFHDVIRDTPDYLFFTADETMMSTTRANKVVIPTKLQHYVTSAPPEMPHITAMCACNLVGIKPPVFIIIKDKKKVPHELKEIVESRKAWIASTSSGWMERSSFMLWCIMFCSWYTNYKASLPRDVQNKHGLLILDGHTSRENPAAIELFYSVGIIVLILPSHCTHAIQLFDVGLAGSLKERFTVIFYRNLKNEEMYVPSNLSASIRRIAVESFIEAWDITCSREACKAAAAAVGYRPLNVSKPLSNKYVRQLNAQEKANLEARERRRSAMLNINNCCLSTQEKWQEMINYLSRRGNSAICKSFADFPDADSYYRFFFQWSKENGTILFSKPEKVGNFSFDHLMDTFQ